MFTTTVDIEDGHTEDGKALLLLDDSGRELKPGGKEALVVGAEDPLWLRDNATIVYMTQGENQLGLYSLQFLNVFSGPAGKAFEGRTFMAADRISGSNAAIAVERDHNMDGPPRLQKLELLAQEDTELATLDGFAGRIEFVAERDKGRVLPGQRGAGNPGLGKSGEDCAIACGAGSFAMVGR